MGRVWDREDFKPQSAPTDCPRRAKAARVGGNYIERTRRVALFGIQKSVIKKVLPIRFIFLIIIHFYIIDVLAVENALCFFVSMCCRFP